MYLPTSDIDTGVGIGSVWATEPHADLPVKMGTTGAAAKEPSTVFKVFQKSVENYGESPALKFKDTSGVSWGFSGKPARCARFVSASL